MDMQLYGRLFITGDIVAVTGLHIGGSGGTFSIGGVDNPVIVDALTRQPYIPGSSLRGKMRSLTEKYMGRVTGQRISQSQIHSCNVNGRTAEENRAAYLDCPICNIFGITAEGYNFPTRLLVRDVALQPESAKQLWAAQTSLPYTEVKSEVAIDRITSQANPRYMERVPAGAVFGPMELVYSIYGEKDIDWLAVLLDSLQLLEDDYLGGSGSRGSGKIAFSDLHLSLKSAGDYRNPVFLGSFADLTQLSEQFPAVVENIYAALRNGV